MQLKAISMKGADERKRLICLTLKNKKSRICLMVRVDDTSQKERSKINNAANVSTILNCKVVDTNDSERKNSGWRKRC